jgi:hypothetical protein
MTTRQYARLLSEWIASIGLDPHLFGTPASKNFCWTVMSGRLSPILKTVSRASKEGTYTTSYPSRRRLSVT